MSPKAFSRLPLGATLIHRRSGYTYRIVGLQTRTVYGRRGTYPLVDCHPCAGPLQQDSGCCRMIASEPERWGRLTTRYR